MPAPARRPASIAHSSRPRTGEGSGGIAVAQASSGFGGGSTGLTGNSTAQVASSVAGRAQAERRQRTGKSSKASRTREEIELVFDQNKSAIYALYSRALRDNPALQGKVVLEVTIAPSGEVTACRVVSQRTRRCGARAQARGAGEDVPVRGPRRRDDDDDQADRVLPRLSVMSR